MEESGRRFSFRCGVVFCNDQIPPAQQCGDQHRQDYRSESSPGHGGFMAVMTWWLDHGAKLSPHDVHVIFRQLAMQGLAAELRSRPRAS